MSILLRLPHIFLSAASKTCFRVSASFRAKFSTVFPFGIFRASQRRVSSRIFSRFSGLALFANIVNTGLMFWALGILYSIFFVFPMSIVNLKMKPPMCRPCLVFRTKSITRFPSLSILSLRCCSVKDFCVFVMKLLIFAPSACILSFSLVAFAVAVCLGIG